MSATEAATHAARTRREGAGDRTGCSAGVSRAGASIRTVPDGVVRAGASIRTVPDGVVRAGASIRAVPVGPASAGAVEDFPVSHGNAESRTTE